MIHKAQQLWRVLLTSPPDVGKAEISTRPRSVRVWASNSTHCLIAEGDRNQAAIRTQLSGQQGSPSGTTHAVDQGYALTQNEALFLAALDAPNRLFPCVLLFLYVREQTGHCLETFAIKPCKRSAAPRRLSQRRSFDVTALGLSARRAHCTLLAIKPPIRAISATARAVASFGSPSPRSTRQSRWSG